MTKISTIRIPGNNDIVFVCPENCGGETLIAELYGTSAVEDVDDITVLYTVSTGLETGRNKGDIIEMKLDFTNVESGDYYCKIYTAETGVLAKTLAIIYNE
jgi:hypothetical protein